MINTRINSAWNGLLPLRALDELDQTAFMSRCRSGVVSRRELEVFLVQQHHYSRHFTRYLCALLANLSNELDRLALTKNLFEEMGLGDMGDEPHVKIYRDMLFALESVRKVRQVRQSFLSMRQIEARRRKASAFRVRFSKSLARRRQRLSQAKVRSTTHRRGKTAKPFA